MSKAISRFCEFSGIAIILLAGAAGALHAQSAEASSPDNPGKPELWNRAVSTFAGNRLLAPGHVKASFSLLDGKGEAKQSNENEIRYFLDNQGRIQSELVRALENGQDVTVKARAEADLRKKNPDKKQKNEQSMTFKLSDVPFDPAKQDLVNVKPISEKTDLYGYSCRRFDFSLRLAGSATMDGKKNSVTLRGMAWIDENNGCPVKLEYATDPLPAKVKSLWTVYTYGPGPHGEWLLKEIAVEGVGGFLFIKKKFRTHVDLSDYFPFQEEKQSPH